MIAAAVVALLFDHGCSDGNCLEFDSPCPEPFDVGEWCGENGGCTVDGIPADCADFRGCVLERGQVLAIPLGSFRSSLEAQDLEISLSNSGCSEGDGPEPEEFAVALDGADATPSKLGTSTVFRWDPFPDSPAFLNLRYDDVDGLDCLNVSLSFLDAECESENPRPTCAG